jgi:hypothetical protein
MDMKLEHVEDTIIEYEDGTQLVERLVKTMVLLREFY